MYLRHKTVSLVLLDNESPKSRTSYNSYPCKQSISHTTSYHCQSHLFDNSCQHANQTITLAKIYSRIRPIDSSRECRVHNEDDIINQCMMRMHLRVRMRVCVYVWGCMYIYVHVIPFSRSGGRSTLRQEVLTPLCERDHMIELVLKSSRQTIGHFNSINISYADDDANRAVPYSARYLQSTAFPV